jgi:hypothetical protein
MGGKARTPYKRLPGRGPRKRGFFAFPFSRCSLYLGDDHLLAVDNHTFSEDYRRFYFSDIETIITRKTRRGEVWSIVLTSLVICSLAGALFAQNEPFRIFFWFLSGTLTAFLLINVLRGPTCICHIRTAVQEDQLPSLNRLRVARRVIGTLRLAIEKAQGMLSREEITAHQGEAMNPPMPSLRSIRRPRAHVRPIKHDNGTLHMIAFALLLADGLLIGFTLFHRTPVLAAFSYALGLAYTIFIVIALAKQYGTDIPRSIRKMTWACLGFILVSSFLGYIVMVVTWVTRRPQEMMNQWGMYRVLLDLSPHDSPFLFYSFIVTAFCSLALGALGLIRVMKHRNGSAATLRPVLNPGGKLQV